MVRNFWGIINKMEFTKKFLIGYGFTYLIMRLLSLPLILLISELPIPQNSLLAIPTFIINFFIIIFNILSFSTEYAIINVILWSFRAIVLIEIVHAIRG